MKIILELSLQEAAALADAIEYGVDHVSIDYEDVLQRTANAIRDASDDEGHE